MLLAKVQSENEQQVFLKPLKIFKGPAQDIVIIDKEAKNRIGGLVVTTDCDRDWNSFWKESREENRIVLVFTKKYDSMHYRIADVCNPTTNAFDRDDSTLIELDLTKTEFEKFGLPTYKPMADEFFTEWQAYKKAVTQCPDIDCFMESIGKEKIDGKAGETWKDKFESSARKVKFEYEKRLYSDPEIIKNNFTLEKYVFNSPKSNVYLFFRLKKSIGYFEYPPILAVWRGRFDYYSYMKMSAQEKWGCQNVKLISEEEYQHILSDLKRNTDQ